VPDRLSGVGVRRLRADQRVALDRDLDAFVEQCDPRIPVTRVKRAVVTLDNGTNGGHTDEAPDSQRRTLVRQQ
jgi:hypothetical protein